GEPALGMAGAGASGIVLCLCVLSAELLLWHGGNDAAGHHLVTGDRRALLSGVAGVGGEAAALWVGPVINLADRDRSHFAVSSFADRGRLYMDPLPNG